MSFYRNASAGAYRRSGQDSSDDKDGGAVDVHRKRAGLEEDVSD